MTTHRAPSLLRTLLLTVALVAATAWLRGQSFPPPANAISIDCDDGIACTLDSGNAGIGQCSHVPNDGACSDGDACTVDTCDPQTGCVHTPAACDDNNACTIDACDPQTGCVHTTVACDDNNPCTTDACDPQTGCVHTTAACDDNNACTIDTCDAERGCVYILDSCDDNDPCTADFCDSELGCSHKRTCADTYLCYDTKASKKTPEFTPIPNVHVTDFFENLDFTVAEPREICNPAGHEDLVNGGGDHQVITIPDTATHLNRYQITVPKKTPRNMQKNVQVETEFGTFAVDLVIGDKLFVPTAKAIGQPPLPLETVADHYKCYDVKLHAGKFPKKIQVSLVDQFLLTPQTFTLTGVSHLCPVAEKNTEEVVDNCAVLACFDLKPATAGGKFKAVKNVFTLDQFGPFKQDTVDYDDVCVPATIPTGENSRACIFE